MAYANPYYDPAWKTAHDFHYAEAERLRGVRERLAAGGAAASDAYQEVEAELKWHHQAGQDTFRQQHETVQEYAAWVFRNFPRLPHLYAQRHLIECCFSKLKQFRRVATCFEKTAENYRAVITLAAIVLWLR